MLYKAEYWDDVKRVIPHIKDMKQMYGKTLLLTGGCGLICSCVVDIIYYLNQHDNADITIIQAARTHEEPADRFPHMKEGVDYQFVYYDATKTEGIDVKSDYIIHAASNANPAAYVKEPVETMAANFIGLNNLLSMACKRGIKRLLYISSSEVYGQKDNMEPYFENDYGYLDILNQRASYPSSKRASETLCVAYSMEYGMDTVIARPGHIYGPGVTPYDNRATAQFTRNAVAGEDIVMKSAGSQLRSYCYALDCASALLAILLSGEKQNAYNISNPDSIITISEIAHHIANAAGTQLTYENPDDAEAAGYNLMSNSSLDSKKLEGLGWAAEFSPEEGADRCVRFYGEG